MACRRRNDNIESVKRPKKLNVNEKYLGMIFNMLKKRDALSISDRETHFNDTEIRLIGEVISAGYEGKRLISTQLAKLLGVTRSAISQIVNRLEEQGVVKRVADEVDRKIAYIEITEDCMEKYGRDLEICLDFVGRVVNKFGVEKFNAMYELQSAFLELIENEKAEYVQKFKRK